MDIHEITGGDALRADRPREPGRAPGCEGPTEMRRVKRGDRVEISLEGRVLAADGAGTEAAGEELSSDRIAEILVRIRDGSYHTREVAEAVARRLLTSGDL